MGLLVFTITHSVLRRTEVLIQCWNTPTKLHFSEKSVLSWKYQAWWKPIRWKFNFANHLFSHLLPVTKENRAISIWLQIKCNRNVLRAMQSPFKNGLDNWESLLSKTILFKNEATFLLQTSTQKHLVLCTIKYSKISRTSHFCLVFWSHGPKWTRAMRRNASS